MKSQALNKKVLNTKIWPLMKYALLSIVVLGITSIIAIRIAGGTGEVEGEIFGLVDNTLLDATPDWIQAPDVAMNDKGTIITAYTKLDSRFLIDYGLYTRLCRNGVWENPVLIVGIEQVTMLPPLDYHQITLNESDKAGLIYELPGIDLDAKFGVAYFDGSTWNYNISVEGDVGGRLDRHRIVGMDSNGVLYVAYQILNPDYSCGLVVARFNKTGLIDKTHFPSICGADILLSINKEDEVMVLLGIIGTRIFNGTSWGELAPLDTSPYSVKYLKFYDSGKADSVTGSHTHYHYNGTSWGTGYEIIDMYEYPDQTSVAASNNGTIMFAYTTDHEYKVKARFFNGSVWGPISTLLDDGIYSENPRVLVDGKGRFAVIHDVIVAYCFDGTWHGQVILDGAWGVLKPAMAMNDKGDFTIINSEGSNDDLYGMRFFFRPTGTIPIVIALPWIPMLLLGD